MAEKKIDGRRNYHLEIDGIKQKGKFILQSMNLCKGEGGRLGMTFSFRKIGRQKKRLTQETAVV